MSYDNHIIEVEIVLAIKNFQVLGPITFGGYSFPQKIQNSIGFLRLITFKSCNSLKKIQNSIRILGLKTFRGCNTPQD